MIVLAIFLLGCFSVGGLSMYFDHVEAMKTLEMDEWVKKRRMIKWDVY